MRKLSLFAILPLLTGCLAGAENAVPVTTLNGQGINSNQVMKVQALNWTTNHGENVSVNQDGSIKIGRFNFQKPIINEDGTGTFLSVAGPVTDREIDPVSGEQRVSISDKYLKLNGDRPVHNNIKLSYTDFGYIWDKVQSVNGETEEYKGTILPVEQGDAVIYGGAYQWLEGGNREPEDYQKSRADLGNGTTFTGRAMGYAQIGEEASGAPKTIFLDGTASLTAKEALSTEKLDMHFDNWSDVTYDASKANIAEKITFSNPAAEGVSELKNKIDSENLKFDVGYYGVKDDHMNTGADSTVIEAVGSLQAGVDDYKLRVSFGATNK